MAKLNLLTDIGVRQAKPAEKRRKLKDGGGLFLVIDPKGHKRWQYRYLFQKRERAMSLGVYPDVTLSAARERRQNAAELLVQGADPLEERERAKRALVSTFGHYFEQWHANQVPDWSEVNSEKVRARIERDILPKLGEIHIHAVRPKQVQDVLLAVCNRGAVETARRMLWDIRSIYELAAARTGKAYDPTLGAKTVLPKPGKGGHFAAITEPAQFGELLRSIDQYEGRGPVVRSALQLAPLVAVRPGELRQAKWADFDFASRQWEFVASKTGEPHVTPLSSQAVEILEWLRPETSHQEYVFPSLRPGRPISDNALRMALRNMGYPKEVMSVHGFRAAFRTIADEVLGANVAHLEQQLAHRVRDLHGRSYNRTHHLPQRRELMQRWADYLGGLKAGGNVVVGNFRQDAAAE